MLKSAKSIGEIIYYFRLVKNYSQNDLAALLNVTVSAVSSWERGINKPGVDIALKLADDMGISLDAFYKDKDKNIHGKKYMITDLVTFEKAYLRWHKVNHIKESNSLQIGLFIWGLSVQKESLSEALKVTFKSKNNTVLKVTNSEVVGQESPTSRLSPELKMMPILHPPGYLVLYTLEIDELGDIQVEIEYQGEHAIFVTPGLLIQAIVEGVPFDVQNPVTTLEFIKSDIFHSVLKYYATIDEFDALQAYLVGQYSALSRYIKPKENLQ
jgi:transcriptional regulator with XRE-family HTH domain